MSNKAVSIVVLIFSANGNVVSLVATMTQYFDNQFFAKCPDIKHKTHFENLRDF